jgi:tRNA(Ile)-lysidine synthase
VAYSGGRDSTALLHATLAVARSLDIGVVALHVHHGLSPNADAWLEHCAVRCARWRRAGHDLLFANERLKGAPAAGESVEAWARAGRYDALRRLATAHGASLVLLAHHRRDQAETFLLQALRGAGAAGLAAMPRLVARDGIAWARPWLERSAADLDAYVRRHRLTHVVDESNADPRHERSRLRTVVWPAFEAAFPRAEATLAAAARWAQEAASALDELATLDLANVAPGDGLDVGAWSHLSAARRANALRLWLRRSLGAPPPASLVTRLLDELPHAPDGRWPTAAGELRVHRGALSHVAAREPSSVVRETSLQVQGTGLYPLPGWAGTLRVVPTPQAGVALEALAHLDLVARGGAERWQAGPGRPPRSLKKQYQAASVPAWQRTGPLVYSAGRLVFVPGLGLDARMLAPAGAVQARLEWLAAGDEGGAMVRAR